MLDGTSVATLKTIALCGKHWIQYQHYNIKRLCHVADCVTMKIPFPTFTGVVHECAFPSKQRILNMGPENTPDEHSRKTKRKRLKDDSPDIPPLGHVADHTILDLTLSGTSSTYSTASNNDDLQNRLKDLGGRTMAAEPATPQQVIAPVAAALPLTEQVSTIAATPLPPTQETPVATHQGRRNSAVACSASSKYTHPTSTPPSELESSESRHHKIKKKRGRKRKRKRRS